MRTVLVIDDNPAVVEALRVMFALHDIRTLSAATPEEGLATLARADVDLAIADMNFAATPRRARRASRSSAASANAMPICRSSC